ncbi:SusC/RagA family TonB-linked outer membrane protein [Larkinella sp. GY13]|uniref:SusC/RagA family TonB-linked outer membrane protein n=1 Tax=Larkinella sp. GY13 TaxID=3453720 RepID=UPI003EEE8A9F
MHKLVLSHDLLQKIMRISLLQLVFYGLFFGIANAHDGLAQEILNQRVTIDARNQQISLVLNRISRQTGVRFMYSPELIQAGRKVSLKAAEEKLSTVLTTLLSPLKITFELSGQQILLRRVAETITPTMEAPGGNGQVLLKDITGTVTDEAGQALPGVSVVIKGTQRGTTTDSQGAFRINVPDASSTLIFSFVGYVSKEVNVGNQTTFTIALLVDDKTLNEVVVVGYGEQAKKELTTSIAKVSGKDINQLPVSTPGDALAGLAPGVQVQSGRGGSPGDAPTIRIRGAGSLGAGNDPLYVVDGYPLQNSAQFTRLSPTDIESIEILKDAASAAIYGSRAANGVVIVTTKRGKAGKTRFDLNTYTGIQDVPKRIDVMNKEQYLTYSKEAARVRNERYPDIFDRPDELADTDWQDVIFRTAPMSQVQLTASGGSEKTRFSISGSYLTQKGTLIGTDYKLATFRANFDADLSSKLKVGVNFAPSYVQQNVRPAAGTYQATGDNAVTGAALPSPIYSALVMPPIIPARLANGNYGQANADPSYLQYGYLNAIANLYNPLAVLELVKNQANSYRLLSNTFLEWEPIQGLKLRTQGGISLESTARETYVPPTLAYDGAPTASLSSPNFNGIASEATNNRTIDYVWENTLTYTKRLNSGHNFSGLLLYSNQKFSSFNTSISGRAGTYTTDLVQNPTASPDRIGNLGYGLNAFMSLAVRINYDYKSKYLFSAAIRRDGSSRFGPDERFGTFPSVSVGWRIGEEGFMKQQNLVSELKVRASYGQTGNANIGDFSWLSGIGSTNYSFGNQRVFGTQQSGYANSGLTWEKNQQVDLGLEAGFWQDRLYLTIDAYDKITEGMLFSKELPAVVGYANSFLTNVGKLQNRGLEISLSTRNTGRGSALTWTTDFNIAFNRTKVLDLGGRQSLNTSEGAAGWPNGYRIEVGQPLGNMYGFIIDGVFKTTDELAASAKWAGGSQVGDLKPRDVNADGVVNELDRTVLGNGLPKFTYGFTNRLNYKNIDLSVIIQGTQGNNIINGNARHSEAVSGRFNAITAVYNNYFLASDPSRDVKYPRNNPAGITLQNQLTSYVVYDGSFLRVRNVTLGYTLPGELLKRVGLQSARIYVSGQNLLTFTSYPGFNPEPSQYGDSVYQPGSDQGTYPANRTLTAGLNIGF